MTAMSERSGEAPGVNLWSAILRVVLSVVLAHVALFGLVRLNIVVNVLSDAGLLWGPVAWPTTGMLAKFLLIVAGAVAGVLLLRPWKAVIAIADFRDDEDNPDAPKTAVMSALLGMIALGGLSAAAGLVGAVLSDPRIEHPVNWLTWAHLGLFLLVGGSAVWGLTRLKPWSQGEPASPATRKTNLLFGAGGVLSVIACLPLIFGGRWGEDEPPLVFTNGPVPLWVAAFAIPVWLLAWAISYWWYVSADEHEKRASDVGLLFAGLFFAVVTPAWWVAARAGLIPEPSLMGLWLAVSVIWSIGWFWRRNR